MEFEDVQVAEGDERLEFFERKDAFLVTIVVDLFCVVHVFSFDRPEEVNVQDRAIAVERREELRTEFHDRLVHVADLVAMVL